ncbi:hypothetical protein Ahy_A03g012461 isoform A [Arachis hypogaea]|uniref:PB1-like domain-containing protein n=1 Tax=Arachis hypogaea TaxID=3818 RepID=A0A445DTG5_ARAHY|nr:hypothetical protein Ahy_A03g012461 isoform A [Arachis hypogaea]
MFHHDGTFKKNVDGILVYSPDNRSCLGDLDENTLDVFFVRNYFKELGYNKVVECCWLVSNRSLEVGLRALTSDDELKEMCFHAEKNDGVVDAYFEHGVSTPELLEVKGAVMLLDCEAQRRSCHRSNIISVYGTQDKISTNCGRILSYGDSFGMLGQPHSKTL